MGRRARLRALRALLGRHYVTTPSSMVNRMMGLETWPDAVTFSGGVIGTLTGNVTGAIPVLPAVAIAAATTTLTLSPATHAGKAILLSSTAGLAITPPAATGTLNVYGILFTATISGGNVTFDAKAGNASDVIKGVIDTNKVGTGLTQYGTISNTNLITFDGTTRGGIAGDYFQLIDVATNLWIISGCGQQSGTIATPFTNH